MPTRERKAEYFAKMQGLLAEYTKCFIVHADHVGSKQFQDIRVGLRGKGAVLMGKNTMMRKVINGLGKESPYAHIVKKIVGNVGLVFVKDNLAQAKGIIKKYTVPAPARAGVVANAFVTVPAGPTGCDPSQTGYFQTMDIPTKITKGQIEIVRDVPLINEGDRVTAGQADLLQKLGIKPFTYGLHILEVFDNGSLFAPAILDISDSDLIAAFTKAARNVAALSFSIGVRNVATVPHSIRNAVRSILAVGITEGLTFSFKQAKEVKDYLANPGAFAAASGAAAGGNQAAAAAPEPEPEEEEEEVVINLGGDAGGDSAW